MFTLKTITCKKAGWSRYIKLCYASSNKQVLVVAHPIGQSTNDTISMIQLALSAN